MEKTDLEGKLLERDDKDPFVQIKAIGLFPYFPYTVEFYVCVIYIHI